MSDRDLRARQRTLPRRRPRPPADAARTARTEGERPLPERQAEGPPAEPATPQPVRGPRRVRPPVSEGEIAGYPGGAIPAFESPLVPNQLIAGRALVVVVAIMTFLAAITVGAVTVVRSAAGDWQSDIVGEMTVQLQAVGDTEPSRQIDEAIAALAGLPGVGEVRALSVRETEALLEPWLGEGVALEELPVPRLVLIEVADPAAIDAAALRAAIAPIEGATLDDHRAWGEELTAAVRAVTVVGLATLVLMLTALVISVVFATRAAMASNAQTIEVLHFCGAESGFIARQFERRFLVFGLVGGVCGGAAALAAFAALSVTARLDAGSIGYAQARLFLGTPEVGVAGYAGVLCLVAAVALIAALTTRLAVHAHLERLD